MFDFKYHIVSLVAVFLALGIGVVMGSMTAERGVVTQQERNLIKTMEQDFERLRANNKDLNDKVAVDTAFAEAVIPLLVDGRLAGKNVAVVITGSAENDTLISLKKMLEKAGARQQSVTRFSGNLGLDNKDTLVKAAGIVEAPGQALTVVRTKMLEETARWISAGTNPPGLNDLAKAGTIKIDGSYDTPVQDVIVIGGTENGKNLKVEELDEPLIKTFLSQNVVVAGVESSTVKNSYMKAYQNLGLSTVDNIDLNPGLVSVVYILSGQPGNFGGKPTALTLMPQPVKS